MAHALRDARHCWHGYATRAQKIRGAALCIKFDEAREQWVDLKMRRKDLLEEKVTALAREHPKAKRLSLLLDGDLLAMTRRMLVLDSIMDQLTTELDTIEDCVRAEKARQIVPRRRIDDVPSRFSGLMKLR